LDAQGLTRKRHASINDVAIGVTDLRSFTGIEPGRAPSTTRA
jgi:hypothetical protein